MLEGSGLGVLVPSQALSLVASPDPLGGAREVETEPAVTFPVHEATYAFTLHKKSDTELEPVSDFMKKAVNEADTSQAPFQPQWN